MFKESDQNLVFLEKLITVVSFIAVLGCVITAICLWVTSSVEVINGEAKKIVDGFRVGMGFVAFFVGPLLVWINYKIWMVVISFLYDIKLIRNKLYNINSEKLYRDLFNYEEEETLPNKNDYLNQETLTEGNIQETNDDK
ncbi:MAG TPA: hypothetical protein VIL24_01195 [Clostridia bacterium]